jgi:PhzF family phenazine biosynthesis protein
MLIYHVDAFTDQPFMGNPAAVCILDRQMPDEWMQKIAFEMNLSETSFVIPGQKESTIRFFTPAAEIPLCGHATLSTAHVFFESGLASAAGEIVFISKAGKLTIRKEGKWIVMNFPSYDCTTIEIPPDVENILGIKPVELYKTGHGWKLALLSKESELRSLKPDPKILVSGGFGDLIVTAPSDDNKFDFTVRCFAPALGIEEDPVTGSAHCSLAPFWHARTGKLSMMSHQISARGGILRVEICGNRVEVAGEARTIFKGELLV